VLNTETATEDYRRHRISVVFISFFSVKVKKCTHNHQGRNLRLWLILRKLKIKNIST